MRVPALLVLACLGFAACGSDRPDGGVAGVETVKRTSGPRGAWATEEELAWLRELSEWSERFARAGRDVAAYERDPVVFERVLRGDRHAVEGYAEVLEPIRGCPESFAREVRAAPTIRLRETSRRFTEACRRFRRGVGLLLDALRDGDETLAEEARHSIEEAGKEASVATGTLPPGEKQELPVIDGRSRESRIDPRSSAAAGVLAGKDVEVRCWSRRDWQRLMVEERLFTRGRVNEDVLGFASAGGRRINLSPSVCDSLGALVHGRERPRAGERRRELALALVTLAHESVHAAGRADEPTAECHGIQLADDAAEELGVERAYAEALVDLYWSAYDRLPAAYRSPECRDGGDLDLAPGDGRFP